MANDNRTAAVGALMLVAGGVIGSGLALLFAPQSGRKTRKQIVRYGRRVHSNAEEMAREVADTVTDLVENLGEKTGDLFEHGGEIAEDWRKYLLDRLEHGQKSLERQRKRLVQVWK